MTSQNVARLTALTSLLLSCLLTSTATAQQAAPSVREVDVNGHIWLVANGNNKLTDKLGVHTEVQVRRADFGQEWQQLLLRGGLDYHWSEALRLTAGYAFVQTWPYGQYPVKHAFPEHRIWEQALVTGKLGDATLQHRYRLEQRFIGDAATGRFEGGRYENRLRYMARLNIPLSGETIDDGELYAALYDEVFINFGEEVKYNIFDQNRAYGALGYQIGPVGRVEIGYMNQLVQQRSLTPDSNKQIIESNNTMMLSFSSNFSFAE